MNKLHEERDRLAVRCFNNLPPEIAEPRIIGFRFGFDAASEIHKKRIERLREALNKLTEEMQVFLNASLKHHFPDAREAQANAIAALQEDGK